MVSQIFVGFPIQLRLLQQPEPKTAQSAHHPQRTRRLKNDPLKNRAWFPRHTNDTNQIRCQPMGHQQPQARPPRFQAGHEVRVSAAVCRRRQCRFESQELEGDGEGAGRRAGAEVFYGEGEAGSLQV